MPGRTTLLAGAGIALVMVLTVAMRGAETGTSGASGARGDGSGPAAEAASQPAFADLRAYLAISKVWDNDHGAVIARVEAERKRLGDGYVPAVGELVGDDLEANYWAASYVSDEVVAQPRDDAMALLLLEQCVRIAGATTGDNGSIRRVSAAVSAAVHCRHLGLETSAMWHKHAADSWALADPSAEGSYPAMDPAERALYEGTPPAAPGPGADTRPAHDSPQADATLADLKPFATFEALRLDPKSSAKPGSDAALRDELVRERKRLADRFCAGAILYAGDNLDHHRALVQVLLNSSPTLREKITALLLLEQALRLADSAPDPDKEAQRLRVTLAAHAVVLCRQLHLDYSASWHKAALEMLLANHPDFADAMPKWNDADRKLYESTPKVTKLADVARPTTSPAP